MEECVLKMDWNLAYGQIIEVHILNIFSWISLHTRAAADQTTQWKDVHIFLFHFFNWYLISMFQFVYRKYGHMYRYLNKLDK